MPEVELAIRWADGHVQSGRSPSRVIEQWLVEHAVYPRNEMAQRVRHGLAEASDRVRQRYGHACAVAAQLSDELLNGAAAHGVSSDAPATVERLRRASPAILYPAPERIASHVDVAIVGAGQAGLALSWHLRELGIEHLVLERDRVASSWRNQRWDTFSLVTPNWQCRLPGHGYAGPDPDGFMVKDEIIEYVESFAASFRAPIHEGVEVRKVRRQGRSGFVLSTSHGELRANQVVLAVGGYHQPRLPEVAGRLPATITQLHSSTYRNPSSLPDGAVLVVGTGQSGAQIAEDLLVAGRDVHLCVGSAPRVARFYRGRDCVAWLEDIGHYDMPVDEHPEGPVAARHEPNHYVTGRDGGHDIDLRAHALSGMKLHGRLTDARDGKLSFTADLRENLDAADATAERIKDTIDRWIDDQKIDAPEERRHTPVWAPPGDGSEPLDLERSGLRTVIWATGFRSDWSWVDVRGFTRDGYPRYTRGVCEVPGMYALGLPWLYTWGSGRFAGIDRDARHVAERIVQRARIPANVSGARSGP
jgi:putative flavoprotein involved in K+ transport